MCSVTPPVTDIATVGPKSWSRFLGVSRDICTGCGVRARGVGAAIDRACVGVWVRNLRDPLGCSRGSGTVLVLSVLLVLVSISTDTNTQGGLGLQHPTPHRETFSGGQPHAIQNIEVVLSVDYVTSSYLLRHTIIHTMSHHHTLSCAQSWPSICSFVMSVTMDVWCVRIECVLVHLLCACCVRTSNLAVFFCCLLLQSCSWALFVGVSDAQKYGVFFFGVLYCCLLLQSCSWASQMLRNMDICMHTHACMCIYIYAHIDVCAYVCVCVYVCAYVRVCVHIYKYMYVFIYIYIHIWLTEKNKIRSMQQAL